MYPATQTVKLLADMLSIRGSYCPTKHHSPFDEELLYELAERNKVLHALSHIITCRACSRRTSKRLQTRLLEVQSTQVLRTLVYQSERNKLQSILKTQRICAIEFKRFPAAESERWTDAVSFNGSDLDILVARESVSRLRSVYSRLGYRVKNAGWQKEVQLVNPKNGFAIDMHFLLAYPHYGTQDAQQRRIVERVTKLLVHGVQQGVGLSVLSPELYLVGLCVRHWYNDLLCGFRSLCDVAAWCRRYADTINWHTLLRIAVDVGIHNELLCTLLLAQRFLKSSLATVVRRRVPFRVAVCAAAVTLEDIAVFPPITKWYNASYQRAASARYERYMLIHAGVHAQGSVKRVLWQKMLIFWSLAFAKYVQERIP